MIKVLYYFIDNKKGAKVLAFVWTLLIFIACLLPANEIPNVQVPLIDKWAHFIMFSGFSFLMLCSFTYYGAASLLKYWMLSIALGAFIEGLQAAFPGLGRCYEFMDIVADAIGGLLGMLLFAYIHNKYRSNAP